MVIHRAIGAWCHCGYLDVALHSSMYIVSGFLCIWHRVKYVGAGTQRRGRGKKQDVAI